MRGSVVLTCHSGCSGAAHLAFCRSRCQSVTLRDAELRFVTARLGS